MCTTCGCGDPEIVPVELHERILAGNDRAAAHNREHFLERGVLALNLMGSPGAGKTAVLEATAGAAAGRGWRLGAVSADLATDNDARRLERAGIPSRAITTGQACHLDAELVHRSLHGFSWEETDVFFIENVGNLVCPAIYDLGQRANVVVLSIAEGEDKPLKYPVMFKVADLVLLTKVDLAPHLDVDLARVHDAIAHVMPRPRVIEVSARTGAGIDRWIAWLDELRASIAKPAERRTHHHDDPLPHEHVHAHDHAHGGVRHAHPHAHAHAHGAGDHHPDGEDDGHAHERATGHDHAHAEAAGAKGTRKKAPARRASRAKPVRAKPVRAKPVRAKPAHAKPSRAKRTGGARTKRAQARRGAARRRR
jgi:hydrogenase nickel incorporation protein HypB